MYLQIKKLVLWPRTGDHKPRTVIFKTGALNVISGVSKTGKSAIIPIIDYCLGAEKCSIPVETIRHACSWFGIVIDTAQGEMLLARREPGNQKATGDMFVLEGPKVTIPDRIERHNTNVDAVKVTLNDLAGLTQLEFEVEDARKGFKDRPSFRDMTPFVFQPQNIIANANVLFYKADITEHREKLRTIFPYVLGAITTEVLAFEHELQRVRLELRKKERELETLRQLSERWVSEIRGKISRARELGLIAALPPQEASVLQLIGVLRSAVANADIEPELTAATLTETAEEVVTLQQEEASASTSLSRLKQRFTDMTRFRDASEEYRGSLSVRRDRLQIADWLRGLHDNGQECPLCGSIDHASGEAVEVLHNALLQIEEQAGSLRIVPAAFDREYQRVRDEMHRETEHVNAVRYRRRALEGSSQEIRDRQYQLTAASRFIGSLDEALDRYEKVAVDSDLNGEVAGLRERLATLEGELRSRDVKGATARAAQKFALLAGRILPSLDTEWPNAPVLLAIDDLTVKVAREGRDDYLWEIGSGANWLAYHIATSIALHELFRDLKLSPVPSFVVYDQPSQVYFPRRGEPVSRDVSPSAGTETGNLPEDQASEAEAAADSSDSAKAEVPVDGDNVPSGTGAVVEAASPSKLGLERGEERDEDVRAVRRVFATVSDAVDRGKGAWQAIVLDHASDEVWGSVPGVHLVEEWRNGLKLIPQSWLD